MRAISRGAVAFLITTHIYFHISGTRNLMMSFVTMSAALRAIRGEVGRPHIDKGDT
jgi:hypothetical protein